MVHIKEIWPRDRFQLCVHCDLGLGDTLGEGHGTHLSHCQQLCEISSRFNMAVKSYSPDTYFFYMCAL